MLKWQRSSKIFVAGAILLGAFFSNALLVNKALADSSLEVVVCGGDAEPQLTLLSPPTDSTTIQSRLTLSGSVLRSNQVIVTIDGAYDQTVSIGSSQSSFVTQVALSLGTHTISAEAVSICGQPSAFVQTVVTVVNPPEPQDTTTPSVISDTAELPPDATSPVTVSPEQTVATDESIIAPTPGTDKVGYEGIATILLGEEHVRCTDTCPSTAQTTTRVIGVTSAAVFAAASTVTIVSAATSTGGVTASSGFMMFGFLSPRRRLRIGLVGLLIAIGTPIIMGALY